VLVLASETLDSTTSEHQRPRGAIENSLGRHSVGLCPSRRPYRESRPSRPPSKASAGFSKEVWLLSSRDGRDGRDGIRTCVEGKCVNWKEEKKGGGGGGVVGGNGNSTQPATMTTVTVSERGQGGGGECEG